MVQDETRCDTFAVRGLRLEPFRPALAVAESAPLAATKPGHSNTANKFQITIDGERL